MAINRKYANLPDLDLSAPDIYETPELTDDNSTIPTNAARTQSDDEFYPVEDDTDAISRSRLRIGDARSRFEPASVDADGVDFSDRVDSKRKSYKVSSRRQRTLQDGTTEFGDLSDDDDEESLQRRIARLTREVHEAKDEYDRLKATLDCHEHNDKRLQSLSDLLAIMTTPAGIEAIAAATTTNTATASVKEPQGNTKDDAEGAVGVRSTYTITYAPTYEQSHALAKAADFDRRLLALERGLGISSSLFIETGTDGLPRAILPTLDSMDKQIGTLAQASTASLDAISRRVRTLASEQDKLNDAREKDKALRDELGKSSSGGVGSPAGVQEQAGGDVDQDAKISALYGVLPTIESLAPVLPPLLDRLRSLRAMHADAAAASQTLEQIEQRQADMTGEIRQWREGLEKLEETMWESDAMVKSNMTVMEGWVKDLEERMNKLG